MTAPNAAPKHYRSKISKHLKATVFRVYGNTCHLCDCEISYGQRSVDHLKSNRAGGSTILSNLRPAHKTCNEFRGARPLSPELKSQIRNRYLAGGINGSD